MSGLLNGKQLKDGSVSRDKLGDGLIFVLNIDPEYFEAGDGEIPVTPEEGEQLIHAVRNKIPVYVECYEKTEEHDDGYDGYREISFLIHTDINHFFHSDAQYIIYTTFDLSFIKERKFYIINLSKSVHREEGTVSYSLYMHSEKIVDVYLRSDGDGTRFLADNGAYKQIPGL